MTPETDISSTAGLSPAQRSTAAAPGKTLRWLAGALVLAAVYFAAAKLGLSLAFLAEQVSAVWPPTGIALAAVLLYGYRVWPGIAVGAFLANVTANEPILTACGIAAGNTLEAVIGAWLLKRVVGFDNALESMRDAIGLILLAAMLSTMVSATIGVTSLCLGEVFLPALERPIEWSDFGPLWWTWWLGDALGALVVAPVLLTWVSGGGKRVLGRPAEAGALIVGLVAASWLAFLGDFTTDLGGVSLAYIVFPFVIWAALRFGQPGTTAVTLVAAALTIWATLNSLGPFGTGPIHERLLLLQVFMGVVAVTALVLGAALAERRRGEEALTAADRRKDEFLATLAHELRNPLAPIRTGVDFLRLTETHDAESRNVLEMLDRQVQQMTRLVDDLLDVSRVTSGKIRLQLQSVDLETVVGQAIETSRPLYEARGHEVAVFLPSRPLVLQADATRLAQVFANLLNNAATYSDRPGHITLTADQEGHDVVVRVRDTGYGIDRETLPHVFDLFTQGDHSLTRSGGGLGIGLTLVSRLVEMHGGSVQAFSEGPGKGSEFVVRLPIAPAASHAGKPPREDAPRRALETAQRILVVDDNLDAAHSLERLLRTDGHKVQVTFSGLAALASAASWQPDVVLLDIGLPDIDGYEVARHIRSHSWGKDVVLIAVTGWGQPDDRKRAMDAGFNHHLTKPVEYAAMSDLLARLNAEFHPAPRSVPLS